MKRSMMVVSFVVLQMAFGLSAQASSQIGRLTQPLPVPVKIESRGGEVTATVAPVAGESAARKRCVALATADYNTALRQAVAQIHTDLAAGLQTVFSDINACSADLNSPSAYQTCSTQEFENGEGTLTGLSGTLQTGLTLIQTAGNEFSISVSICPAQ